MKLFSLQAVCFFALLFCLTASAQELEVQPTPFTALIDFPALQKPISEHLPKQALPIWLETVEVIHNEPVAAEEGNELPPSDPTTTFRLRLRQFPGLSDSLLLRLFFNDLPDARPVVTTWSETGGQKFTSPPLGAGLGLPASESLALSTKEVDYIEIVIPGDGSNLLKALLSTLKTTQTSAAFDFGPVAQSVNDPFGSAAPATPIANDTFLYGRIRATLEPGTVKLSGTGTGEEAPSVQFEFNLDAEPLLAMVTFDILDADPAEPLETAINNTPLGPVSLQLPDLADPAYAGIVRPLEKMRFHYSGWIRCQKIIPGSLLHRGTNRLMLQLPPAAHSAAIRVVEIQLKYHWQQLDYSLSSF